MLSKAVDTVLADLVPAESISASRRVRAVGRLMALLGTVLFIALAIEGVTIVFIGQMIALHVVLGMILIPIMGYKVVVALYRFSMYYLGASDFKRSGPPELVLRLIGPFVILSTVAVMGSGVVLVMLHPGTPTANTWRFIHQASFVVWFGFMAIHVLAYLRRAFGTAAYDLKYTRYHSLIGRRGRLISVALAAVFGVLLAAVIYPYVAPWAHYFTIFHVR